MNVVLKNLVTLLRHAEVMKKIIETVAEGGGELGVHMYPFHPSNKSLQCKEILKKRMTASDTFEIVALFHCPS